MEVAGLVLGVIGALPLIVKAARIYQDIVEILHVKDFMKILERQLQSESVALKNTYERLLDGIVPPWEFHELQAVETSSAKWRQYDHQIRWRLQDSYHYFHSRAKEIAHAVRILQKKLATSPTGEVLFKDWFSIRFELLSKVRVRAHFTLKRKEYLATLTKLRDNNQHLSQLVDEGAAREHTRRTNSRIMFARTIRTTADSLLTALLKTLQCHCVGSHRIGLHLLQVTDQSLASDVTDVFFDMIFCTIHGRRTNISQWEGVNIRWNRDKGLSSKETLSGGISRLVESLALEDEGTLERKSQPLLGARLKHFRPKQRRSPSPSKSRRVSRFPLSTTATPVTTKHASEPKGSNHATTSSPLSHITDLCASIQQNEVIWKRSLGFIPSTKTPKGFDLYRHECLANASDAEVLTLRRALQGNKPGMVQLDIIERYNVALALAIGILQLCNTGWLRSIISPDDIIFLRSPNASNVFTRNTDCPPLFLVCSPSAVACSVKVRRPVNFALLSLGTLLTHIIVGHPVDTIDLHEDMSQRMLESTKRRASKMVLEAKYTSQRYKDAVKWCFEQSACFETLEDEQLCRDFHDEVIARLEKDLRSIKPH